MERKRGNGKERRTLTKIQYYPSPEEIHSKLISRQGWSYKENVEFFLKRDRALADLLYLGALRISEAIRIKKNQFVDKKTHILIQAIKLSKTRVKGKPRRIEYRDVQLPLSGPREPLTQMILDYVALLREEDRLFPFSLEKNEKGQLIGCKRAWQIVHALLPEFTAHWLRAFGEDYLYGSGTMICWLFLTMSRLTPERFRNILGRDMKNIKLSSSLSTLFFVMPRG